MAGPFAQSIGSVIRLLSIDGRSIESGSMQPRSLNFESRQLAKVAK